MSLTHIDTEGRARMVDVSDKPTSLRKARAKGTICVRQTTLDAILRQETPKGDVLAVAQIAGIMAAKRCDELIPLCHGLPMDSISIGFSPVQEPPGIEITAEAVCTGRTGVEMEALTAVAVAALTIYDMVKAIDRTAVIGDIRLIEKSGGSSGHFVAEDDGCVDM